MKTLFGLLVVIIALAVTTGCNKAPTDSGTAAAAKTYEVKGKVIALDPNKPAVTLDHEDIPGLMKAMTMEFRVSNPALLGGIAVGDQVRGQLRKDETGYLVTSLTKQ